MKNYTFKHHSTGKIYKEKGHNIDHAQDLIEKNHPVGASGLDLIGIDKTKKTSMEMIKEHLKSGRGITQLYSLRKYGCMRLAVVISRLKRRGWNIERNMIPQPGKSPYARYKLVFD